MEVREPYESPQSQQSDLPVIIDGEAYPHITRNSLPEISLTSYTLGILFGVFLGLLPFSNFISFNLYIISLSLFHFLEYYVTARWNPGKVHSGAFLLNNGKGYILAHAASILECFIESYFFPVWKSASYSTPHKLCVISGFILVVIGQFVRSIAMYTAGKSFSHILKTEKDKDHELVKDGIYGISRHPGYVGFFYWAIGTQLMVLNPVSFVLFGGVLWGFFRDRIDVEERYLVEFFGEEYGTYRREVAVGIPFIT